MINKQSFSTKKTKLEQTDVIPPLPLKTLQDYAQEIFAPIKRGECVSTIWLPMLGRRLRNKFIISYPQLFEEQIGDLDKYLLVYVEPLELTEQSNIGYIKLIIKSILESYSKCKTKKDVSEIFKEADFYDPSLTSYSQWLENLSKLIKQIVSADKEIVLFLGEFDELEFANSVFYNNLKSLSVRAQGHLFFIFLLLTDVVKQQSITKFGELNELVLRNVVYIPLLSKDDIDYKIDYFSKQLNRSFSTGEKDLLIEVCGGHPYLLKSCARIISLMNGEKLDIPALRTILMNHFEPRSVCQKIFDLLSNSEQEVLRKVTSSSLSNKLPSEADTLAKYGLIKRNESDFWVPFGSLFKLVIEQGKEKLTEAALQTNGFLFDEKSGAIYLGNTNVEEKFTRQEYEILSYFLKDPNKLRSREEIGEAMWGKESYDKYSDWAIDQIMSKIRKKLQILGADKALITVRGRGYKLAAN